MRRQWIWLAAWAATAFGASVDDGRILVVADHSVPAYLEAVQGLKRGLGERTITEVTPAKLADALAGGPVRLAVAIGADARAALAKAKVKAPVISTMLLLADATEETEPLVHAAGAVYLDLDAPQVAHELSRLFPGKKRLGLIAGPSRQNVPNRVALRQLELDGYSFKIAVSPRRSDLGDALRELKGKVDAVLCLADPSLFDSRTIPGLLRAALEHQMAVVGFSPAIVRAGAVAGVFPDYTDIGMQTAAMVARALASSSTDLGEETPRKVASITNPTVMRLLSWTQ